ncbi:MAG: tyrosine decarboxylase MfnA [archaeon]|nr:tyrosine decarboxylase MfnA [archaeon]
MQEKGISKEKIDKIIKERLKFDFTYPSGRILGSMCTTPDEFGLDIFTQYAYKNLGDPGLFPATYQIEKDLIADLGVFLGATDEKITGSIVSGGTEANIIATRIAKKLRPEIKNPEIVCSENAHISFYKAADLMGIKIREVRLTDNYLPEMEQYASLINKNTIGLIGIAGTTSLGLVEPIEKIAKLAESEDIYLHVDAAFGGFILPFMEEMGFKFPFYDFRVPKVDSITTDPHKMGLGLIPSGGLLIREKILSEDFKFSIPYLAGGNIKHLSFTGTRPGGVVIAFWALMKYYGRERFRKMIKECWDNTIFLKEHIKDIDGIEIACNPQINLIGFTSTKKNPKDIYLIDKELRKMNWALGVFEKLDLARIVVMPHNKRNHLEEFIVDLEKAVKIVKNK